MTITLSLQTPEGIVLGADSTTTISVGGGQVHQLYNSAQKVFEIGPRVENFEAGDCFSGAITTSGDGIFGPMSWRSFASKFYQERVRNQSGQFDVCRELLSFAQEQWGKFQDSKAIPSNTPIPSSTLMVAAVCKGSGDPAGGLIKLRDGAIERLDVGDMKISGGFEVVSRILHGYDIRLLPQLAGLGVDVPKFQQSAASFSALPRLDMLPLRDAIDFVHFLIYSAIKLHRYRGGPASIGGAIEIATITPDRGFRWIVHKPLSESIGIPKGGYQP